MVSAQASGSSPKTVLEIPPDRQTRCDDDRFAVRKRFVSRPIAPCASGLPIENANPALVVASASKPSVARMLADPASQGIGNREDPGPVVERSERFSACRL
jgi:hypothetical protein